ncbi:MAG: hypothetical protein ACRD0G_19490, partial [Acidimicrobiales bacterium]
SRAGPLAAADGDRIGVVSLTSYRTAADADEIVAAGRGLDVMARLVAVPGSAPEVASGELEAWIESRRAPLQAERDELAEILPTVDEGSEFIPVYQADIDRLDTMLGQLSVDGELVFALVVRGPADALRALTAQAEVRLVDVGLDDEFRGGASYTGLRPEELDLAGSPDQRPL